MDAEDGQTRRITQRIQVNNGTGYGVIGGDTHIFGEHSVVYLLSEQLPGPSPGAAAYPGGEAELNDLRAWLSGSPRLAVRWLHASRSHAAADLAAAFATDSSGAGWQVLHALHDPERFRATQGHPPLLPAADSAGILVLATAVDQWPPSHVAWLLSNRLLFQAIRARVLLTAASDTRWPAIRGSLANAQAATSSQRLTVLRRQPQRRETTVLDAILTQLATTAGTTIAAAMATDTWQAARAGIVKLFSRREAAEQAAIEAQLDRHNAQVERAGDPAEVRRMMSVRWNSELEGMLTESPDLAGDLQTLVTAIEEALSQQGRAVVQHTVQNVTVGGSSNVTPVVMHGNVYYGSNATPPPAV